MSFTIEEIKQKKIDLEKEVTKLVKDFESETDTRLGYMNISRKPQDHEKESNNCCAVIPDYKYETKDIETVDFDLRFDD